jgi:hypothetical protein
LSWYLRNKENSQQADGGAFHVGTMEKKPKMAVIIQ